MKKYTIIQLLTMILNLFLIFSFIYFWLRVAQFEKYTDLAFSEYRGDIWSSYKYYVKQVFLHGDFGNYNYDVPIKDIMKETIPVSLKINFIAFAVYLPLGVTVGVLCAIFKDTLFDRIVIYITMTLGSIPIYIVMFLLIMYVGFFWEIVYWKYLETQGIWNYLIPTIALIIPPTAVFSRLIRGEIIESMTSDYMLLARAKGLNKRQAILRHTLRNSFIPLMGEIPTSFLYALTGSFFVEVIYRVPGVSNWMYSNLISLSPIGTNYINIHVPALMAISMFYSIMAFSVVFICDIIMKLLDPRIRT